MRLFVITFVTMLCAVAPGGAQAQPDSAPPAQPVVRGAPVTLRADTLFFITARLGPFSAEERARAVSNRLLTIAEDPQRATDSVYVATDEDAASIMLGETVITTVMHADAVAAGVSRDSLAAERAVIIRDALRTTSVWAVVRTVAAGLGLTALATLFVVLVILGLNRVFPAVIARLRAWRGTRIPSVRIQRLVLLTSARATDALIAGAQATRVVLIALLVFWYVPLVLNFFPWTEPYADRFFQWILVPLRQVAEGTLGYIPNVFYIAVIVAVTHYLVRFIRLFFQGIEQEKLVFPGFYPEWAIPTFKIVRFLMLAFALVVIFPYLPGSGSDAFKGVSVFFGVLLSLGSAGAISNVIAGLVMTYMRPFQLGDRVKIADTVGDVIERTLLVTRVRTPKHVEVTVPNAMVLGSHIINYSAAADEGGVILHTTVTIGYDTPWRQVHELLLAAASRTDGLLNEPPPFVLQTALNDFYVAYELNAYTTDPNRMAAIYSDLHQHIQDEFQAAGVQITSPHYETDPPQAKIPPVYAPKPGPGAAG